MILRTAPAPLQHDPPDLVDPCPAPAGPDPSLSDWLLTEALYHQDHHSPASPVIAQALYRLADAAEFHHASTVQQLTDRSAGLRAYCNCQAIVPGHRPHSFLADALDEAAHDYLHRGGSWSRLVAWVLCSLADQADCLGVQTATAFTEALADQCRALATDSESWDDYPY